MLQRVAGGWSRHISAWVCAWSVVGCFFAAAETITPEDPASLKRGILAAVKAGQQKVVVPAGVYRLTAEEKERFHLKFADLSNLEIDATGATFLLLNPNKGGIEFYRCKNLTLRGATLQHAIPPFTQGTIEAIAADGKSFDLRIAKGYPANFDDPNYFLPNTTGYIFDPATRQWKSGTSDMGIKRMERLGDGFFRLHWHGPNGPDKQAVSVGDLMAFRGKGITDIYIPSCSGMNIDGVSILSGGGFCIHEDGGEGGNRYSYKVSYGPKPEGATETPLIACNADAFHSGGVRKGPTLENCLFEGMPDDGVPIHGYFCLVVEGNGNTLTMTEGRWQVGDPLRLFDAAGGYVGEAVVQKIRPLPDYKTTAKSGNRGFTDLEKKRFVEITTDQPLSAKMDFLASNPNAMGRGFVVRNCTIRNHRARGMLLKADDGLVEGNTVEESTIAGIVIAPELWWNEACYSRNVIVRNNTVRRTGHATVGPWTEQFGAITVTAAAKETASPGHRGIVISNNRIEDCDGTNLVITAAKDVLVKDNVFTRAQRKPTTRGKDHGSPAALVWLSACEDVRFENNRVRELGEQSKELVHSAPSAKDVQGATDGVTKE